MPTKKRKSKNKRYEKPLWLIMAAAIIFAVGGIAAWFVHPSQKIGRAKTAPHATVSSQPPTHISREFRPPLLPGSAEKPPEYPKTGETTTVAPQQQEAPAPKSKPEPRRAHGTKPRIAIVIDDMGLNAALSQRATRLPSSITLSFLPYAPNVGKQAQKAAESGHEIILHLPMEPTRREATGPDALMLGMEDAAIRERMEKAIASFSGYDGVNNHMGSRFTADEKGMEVVADVLSERGLFFLDSRTSSASVGETVARRRGVPALSRDVFLDDPSVAHDVAGQLAKTETAARRKGYAIAIGHPHAATLAALEAWLPAAESEGFEIVKLKKLLQPAPDGKAFPE